jgi:hypothetical protein
MFASVGVALVLTTPTLPAQQADAPISWRGRDVAGRTIDLECTVQEVTGNPGGGGDLCGWTELLNDVVYAADARGARGVRTLRRVSRGAPDPRIAIDFFDVDGDGSLRCVRTFGAGPRRYTTKLSTAVSGLVGSRILPLHRADLSDGRRLAFRMPADGGPPKNVALLPAGFEWSADACAASSGGFDLWIAPAVPFPVDAGESFAHQRVTELPWTAHVDAAGVLTAEERGIVVESAAGDAWERDQFTWRETAVGALTAGRLEGARAEGDALRAAYEVLNTRPEEALAHLDEAARLPEPRQFDEVAAVLRDYANDQVRWLDVSVLRALVDAIEAGAGDAAPRQLAAADSLDALLAGRSFEKRDARELFEVGRMIRWVEPDREARAKSAAAVAAAARRRLALDESAGPLADALVVAGIADEGGDRGLGLASSPPADAGAIRRRIEEFAAARKGR